MAHVHAVALATAAAAPSSAMPTEIPMEWKAEGRLELEWNIASTAQCIDGLVAERTGVPGSTGRLAMAEAVRAAKEITFASAGDPTVLDRPAAAKGLRAVMTAMAIPVKAAQERGRAREVFTVVVDLLVKARDAGCSGRGEGLVAAEFGTVVDRLEAAESDEGPQGYLGDLLRFVEGSRGKGAAEEGQGRHARGVHDERRIDFNCSDEAVAGGVPFEFLPPDQQSQAISALTKEGEGRSGQPPTMTAAGGRPGLLVVDAAKWALRRLPVQEWGEGAPGCNPEMMAVLVFLGARPDIRLPEVGPFVASLDGADLRRLAVVAGVADDGAGGGGGAGAGGSTSEAVGTVAAVTARLEALVMAKAGGAGGGGLQAAVPPLSMRARLEMAQTSEYMRQVAMMIEGHKREWPLVREALIAMGLMYPRPFSFMELAALVPEAVVAIFAALKAQRLAKLAVMELIGDGRAAEQERWRAAIRYADKDMARWIRRKEVEVTMGQLDAVVGTVPEGRILLLLLSTVEAAFYRLGGPVTPGFEALRSVVFCDETGRLLVGPAADVVAAAAAEAMGTPHYDTTAAMRCVASALSTALADGQDLHGEGGVTFLALAQEVVDNVTGRWPGEKAQPSELEEFSAGLSSLAQRERFDAAKASEAIGDGGQGRASRVAGVRRAMEAARDDGDGMGLLVNAVRLNPCQLTMGCAGQGRFSDLFCIECKKWVGGTWICKCLQPNGESLPGCWSDNCHYSKSQMARASPETGAASGDVRRFLLFHAKRAAREAAASAAAEARAARGRGRN
jgi:hypothetical protein